MDTKELRRWDGAMREYCKQGKSESTKSDHPSLRYASPRGRVRAGNGLLALEKELKIFGEIWREPLNRHGLDISGQCFSNGGQIHCSMNVHKKTGGEKA